MTNCSRNNRPNVCVASYQNVTLVCDSQMASPLVATGSDVLILVSCYPLLTSWFLRQVDGSGDRQGGNGKDQSNGLPTVDLWYVVNDSLLYRQHTHIYTHEWREIYQRQLCKFSSDLTWNMQRSPSSGCGKWLNVDSKAYYRRSEVSGHSPTIHCQKDSRNNQPIGQLWHEIRNFFPLLHLSFPASNQT